jgi:RNA recognition motif-containing protein
MNKLHITSLPPNTMGQDLRNVFERVGPVLHAKVVNDGKGNCIVGVVEMCYAEDVDEILTTTDGISFGGRRPNICKVDGPTVAERIRALSSCIHDEEY